LSVVLFTFLLVISDAGDPFLYTFLSIRQIASVVVHREKKSKL